MTMAYAKNKGVWPRQKPKPEPPGPGPTPPPGPDPPTPPGPGPTPPGPGPGPTPPGQSPGPAPTVFSAEGVLKDALAQLWEQARAKQAAAIGTLIIRMFEAGDAFRLLGAVGAVSSAEKVVALTGGYETRDGGEFELTFRGPVQDAQPVKEFLEPQLRAAQSRTVEARFELTFTDGLAMDGDAAETLANGLCRFASGAAHVSATAEAKP